MDLTKILAGLREEQDHTGEVILCLEKLALGREKQPRIASGGMARIKKRGRPLGSKNKPKNLLTIPISVA